MDVTRVQVIIRDFRTEASRLKYRDKGNRRADLFGTQWCLFDKDPFILRWKGTEDGFGSEDLNIPGDDRHSKRTTRGTTFHHFKGISNSVVKFAVGSVVVSREGGGV